MNLEHSQTKGSEPKHWDKLYKEMGRKPRRESQKLFARILRRFMRIAYERPLESEVRRIITENQNVNVCLEAGCGSGEIVFNLASYRHIIYSVGVDFSSNAIHIATKQRNLESKEISEKTHFVHGDIRNLPFRENTFDLVLSLGVIEHFENPLALLLEMKRILRVGGILFLSVPNKRAFRMTEQRKNYSRKLLGYHQFYNHLELHRICSKSDLEIMKVCSDDFAWGVCAWYNYITHFSLSTPTLLAYMHLAIILLLRNIFRVLNPFMQNRGRNIMLLAKKSESGFTKFQEKQKGVTF